MKCSNCGAENAAGSKWCSGCGQSLETQNPYAQQPNPYAQQQPNPYAQQQNPYGQPNPYGNNPYGNQPPQYQNDATIQAAKSRASSAMVCGIIGLFFAGFILGIIALVQGVSAKKVLSQYNQPTGSAVAGIVLGVIALVGWVIGIIAVIAIMSAAASIVNDLPYYYTVFAF